MNANGPLSFEAIIADGGYLASLNRMEQRTMGFTSSVARETSKLDSTFRLLSQAAAGYFSFQALASLPGQILKVRGEFQQLEIAFSTMLRSKAKQEQLMSELVQTAATTPFNLKDIAGGAKQLLAYGSAAKDVVGEIRMLGDVASGVSQPLGDLIYLYGTLKTQGRAYAVDIRQFAGRGIPIYQELANVLKINVDQVNDFVSAGKVGFKEVEAAFKNMTSSGGLFAGLMDAQSKSLLGLKERLGDAWDLMLNEIGKKNQDIAGQLLTTATDVVEHYQDVIDILKIAAATYGTYKAAVLIASVAQSGNIAITAAQAIAQAQAASAGGFLTLSQTRAAASTALLTRAQVALNAAMNINPIVAIATAIAALATAYFVFKDEAQEVKSAQEILSETYKGTTAQISQQGSEVKTLIGVIKNQNVAESERLKAYEKLKSIAPDITAGLDFQRAKTADLTSAVNTYLVSLQKKIRLESVQAGLKTAYEQQTEAAGLLKKKQDELLEQGRLAAEQQKKVRSAGPEGGTGGVASVLNLGKIKTEVDQFAQQKQKADKVVEELEAQVSGIYTAGTIEYLDAQIANLTEVGSNLNKLSVGYKQNEEALKKLTDQRDALTKAESKGAATVAKTVEYYDTEIKKLKELQGQNATSRAEFLKYQTQIDAAEKARRRLTGELTSQEKKAAKDTDKVGPFGSVSYWENIAQKADEILQKTPSSNKGEIARQQAIKLDAERKAEEGRKLYAVQTFEEELEEKKKLYELYSQYQERYDGQLTDSRFAQLRKAGKSYLDYLNTQIEKLEADRENVGLTDKQAENLGALLSERDDVTGRRSAIDQFKDSLTKARDEAGSLTDYLEILRQKQATLNPDDNSQNSIAKRLALAEEIQQAERDRAAELRAFLQNATGSEEQRLSITKRYADLRAEVEKKYNGNRGTEYKRALAEINKAEKADFESVQKQTIETSDAFKDLNKVIDEQGRAGLKVRLDRLRNYLFELRKTVDEESEIYKEAKQQYDDTDKALNRDTLDSVNQFAQLAGELGEQISSVNGALGQTGKLLSGIASASNLVTISFDKNASEADKIAAGVQGLINIVGILTSSANERRAAEVEYYRSMIAQQQQYNIALNDQIGLQSELNESVFVKNYEGRLRDGITKMTDANKSYQEALDKLSGGKAKTGQRNAVDWGKVGKAAGSGAATGAAIGALIVPLAPVTAAIGAAIGGIVGGLVGLFGGKKKQDEFGSLLKEYPELVQKTKDGVDELNVSLAQTLIANGLVDANTKLLLEDTIAWTEQIKEAKEQVKGVISELAGELGNNLRNGLVTAFEEGTNAAQVFGDEVGKVLENILSQLIFNQVFEKEFKALSDELEASYDGGDGSWVDDFGRFFGKADELTKLFNEGLASAQDAASAYNLDIFKSKVNPTTKENPNSLSGAIKGVTEETAGILSGQLNAMRISQAEIGGVIRQQLMELSGIRVNTGVTVEELREIKGILRDNNSRDPLRAKGL